MAGTNAIHDQNYSKVILGAWSTDPTKTYPAQINPATGRLLVEATLSGASSGDGALLDGVDSNIRGTVFDLTNSNPVATQIVDASGTAITSFGGGVQYTEGDVDVSITGTALMWEDTSDTLRAVSAAKPLPITGTVIANAGTNLNTSLLALESGGNLATIAGVVRAEDTASADADKGIGIFAIRKATPANLSSLDGDYEFLQMSAGRLWVSALIDTALPAGSNAIGKLAANDGVDIGDVTINNASGASAVNIQDGGNSITVDGSVTAIPSGTQDENLKQVNGITVQTGTGVAGTGTQRVAVASDSSITANAGTNLNTSLLALESGGNLASVKTNTDTLLTRTGDVTETAPATDTASSGLNGRLQRVAQRLTSLIALLPGSLGQKARAASLAVTLSSEDITAISPPAAITGFATSANQTAEQTLVGAVTETAPATDTASSGLNGRLQRIAQRLTTLITTLTDRSQKTQITDGVDDAEVNARTDGIKALEVNDDFTSFEASHQTLVASTDTTITFAQNVRMIQISNWDATNRILVKDGAIASDSSSTAARVGKAPTADVPGKGTFVFKTGSIHIRSAAASEVTITGYY